jgi:hypothetical protein
MNRQRLLLDHYGELREDMSVCSMPRSRARIEAADHLTGATVTINDRGPFVRGNACCSSRHRHERSRLNLFGEGSGVARRAPSRRGPLLSAPAIVIHATDRPAILTNDVVQPVSVPGCPLIEGNRPSMLRCGNFGVTVLTRFDMQRSSFDQPIRVRTRASIDFRTARTAV